MSDQKPTATIPLMEFERLNQIPVELAKLEATALWHRGDTSGAIARLEAAVTGAATIRAQVQAAQQQAAQAAQQQAEQQAAQAAQQQAAQQQRTEPSPPPRNASEHLMAQFRKQQAALTPADAGDPMYDPRLPFGLNRKR
ncbi:MAG: hypothetical protein ACLQGP_15755 [Isosphaeraceae bacterium]